jgi:hypothetical protein
MPGSETTVSSCCYLHLGYQALHLIPQKNESATGSVVRHMPICVLETALLFV